MSFKLDTNGEAIVLLEQDLLIDTARMEGYVSESDNEVTVVLDTNLTPELERGRLCAGADQQDSDDAQRSRI